MAGGDIVGEGGEVVVIGGSAVGGEEGGWLVGVHFHVGDSALGAGEGAGELAAAEISRKARVRRLRRVEEAIVGR